MDGVTEDRRKGLVMEGEQVDWESEHEDLDMLDTCRTCGGRIQKFAMSAGERSHGF